AFHVDVHDLVPAFVGKLVDGVVSVAPSADARHVKEHVDAALAPFDVAKDALHIVPARHVADFVDAAPPSLLHQAARFGQVALRPRYNMHPRTVTGEQHGRRPAAHRPPTDAHGYLPRPLPLTLGIA